MKEKREKIVGILGGMGPEATVDLMQRIIRLTPAVDDADHIRCIVDNNPKVPSRIKAIIEGHGEDPGPCMADMGRRLESWGADFLAIACNTAHYYYDAVQQAVTIPVINLIDLVADHVNDNYPNHRKIGLLASPAVAMTGLYTRRFSRLGIEDQWPDPDQQARLLSVIKAVKKGDTGPSVREDYRQVGQHLKQKGAEIALIACTELSTLGENLPLCALDAAEILAAEIVLVATNRKKLVDRADLTL
ncbi:aspartate/glutamate racemase family protein [Desulfosarcina sp.]|uniref:aspartate/glutamate racemase family protein n=1 Tax=Desulfosarcina sp. TaxID=2027861 RepID=UPI00356A8C08